MICNVSSQRDTSKALSLLTDATVNATTLLDTPLSKTTTQKQLTRSVDEGRLFVLRDSLMVTRSKALIASLQLPQTGAFLNVVPSENLGLKLDSVEFQLACLYRLGLPVFPGDGPCSMCGKDSDAFRDHAISACGHYGD
jgi:hypothetical protein